MTITSENKRNQYTITVGQVIFPYTFRILDQEHLLVMHTTAAGVETELDLTTNYTVSGVGDTGGGNVTTCGDDHPYPTGDIITIIRDVPLTQLVDYVEHDMFAAETHEKGLDKLTMIIQEIAEKWDRMLILTKSSIYSNLTLPNPVAGLYLKWKADISGLENVIAAGEESGTPNIYQSTMTDDETFEYPENHYVRCFLDPNGVNRKFNPIGDYPSGFKLEVLNTGSYIVTVDSEGSAQSVGPGQYGTFIWDGSIWH